MLKCVLVCSSQQKNLKAVMDCLLYVFKITFVAYTGHSSNFVFVDCPFLSIGLHVAAWKKL